MEEFQIPIMKPTTHNCKEYGWSAVKMDSDLKLTSPAPQVEASSTKYWGVF